MLIEQILGFFSSYIESEIGIVYAQHNAFQLQNRLEEIAKLQGLSGIDMLYRKAQEGISGQFKQLLLDVATNNETSFFRDPKVFRAMSSLLFTPTQTLATGSNVAPPAFRIWSAASSTGQEALSASILFTEENQRSLYPRPYSIVATDISERALAKARSSAYTQLEVQRGLSAPLMLKYFKNEAEDRWVARPEITQPIEFRRLNLKENFDFGDRFDLILCRNVLIYQTVEQKTQILSRMTKALVPGGFLILGSGESLIGISTEFDTLNIDGAILYRRKEAA